MIFERRETYGIFLHDFSRRHRDCAHTSFEEDGIQKVEVHFERPSKINGFDTARCQLPSYTWVVREGFSDEEMLVFDQLMHSNAHLFYKYGASGGIQIA